MTLYLSVILNLESMWISSIQVSLKITFILQIANYFLYGLIPYRFDTQKRIIHIKLFDKSYDFNFSIDISPFSIEQSTRLWCVSFVSYVIRYGGAFFPAMVTIFNETCWLQIVYSWLLHVFKNLQNVLWPSSQHC